MEADAPMEVNAVVGALTRPPMMLGIPYVLFILESVIVCLIFINTKNLFTLLLAVPLHGLSYWLTIIDNRFVDILMVRLSKCPPTRNRLFWGGDSYQP